MKKRIDLLSEENNILLKKLNKLNTKYEEECMLNRTRNMSFG